MCFSNKNLIWIDLEMTGLNPDIDRILEIATLITDNNLNIIAEGPNIAIYQEEKYLNIMNKWNIKIHSKNGLIDRVKSSCICEFDAEKYTLNFLKKWVPKRVSPMCGNTVAQDRRFLFKYMPKLESYFHYRYIDVSTLKELMKRWNPRVFFNFNKKSIHNALFDIKESIYELLYYRKFLFNL